MTNKEVLVMVPNMPAHKLTLPRYAREIWLAIKSDGKMATLPIRTYFDYPYYYAVAYHGKQPSNDTVLQAIHETQLAHYARAN